MKDDLTINDFKQWANDPMTIKVRDYMLKQLAEQDSISHSPVVERSVYGDGLTGLEQLGLSTAMKASVICGIELFTNFDDLSVAIFEGGANE